MTHEGKYGYKWAKWITGMELTNTEYRGYWETRGYNCTDDYGGPAIHPKNLCVYVSHPIHQIDLGHD